MNIRSALIPIVLMLAAGCAKVKDRSVLLRGVHTRQERMELRHTKISDLMIRIPDGFVSEWTQEAQYDKFYIYAPSDSGEVQKGMVTLDITPNPAKLIPDTAKYERSTGRMGDHEIQWRERTVVDNIPDPFLPAPDTTKPQGATGDRAAAGPKLYQREMVTRDLFSGLENYTKLQGLVLHAFVVGSDSLLVERLTAVVETITLPPLKPNL